MSSRCCWSAMSLALIDNWMLRVLRSTLTTTAVTSSPSLNPDKQISRKSLPSTGTILADITAGKVGGEQYDRDYPERLRTTIY